MANTWHYYEVHVTWDPVCGDALDNAERLCKAHGYRVADLVMLKGGAPHGGDMFTTARGPDLAEMADGMRLFIAHMQEHGFKLRRYKIEYTLLDSRHLDALGLL